MFSVREYTERQTEQSTFRYKQGLSCAPCTSGRFPHSHAVPRGLWAADSWLGGSGTCLGDSAGPHSAALPVYCSGWFWATKAAHPVTKRTGPFDSLCAAEEKAVGILNQLRLLWVLWPAPVIPIHQNPLAQGLPAGRARWRRPAVSQLAVRLWHTWEWGRHVAFSEGKAHVTAEPETTSSECSYWNAPDGWEFVNLAQLSDVSPILELSVQTLGDTAGREGRRCWPRKTVRGVEIILSGKAGALSSAGKEKDRERVQTAVNGLRLRDGGGGRGSFWRERAWTRRWGCGTAWNSWKSWDAPLSRVGLHRFGRFF